MEAALGLASLDTRGQALEQRPRLGTQGHSAPAEPALIEADAVTRVFGPREREALAMLQDGADKDTILARTSTVLALNRVSFEVPRGEILVVMGLSGSGKSTMLRCLNRLIEPSSGTIRVGGAEVTRMASRELREFRRRNFGMVFQHFALFPHRTILQNVEFGLEVQGIPPAKRRDAAMQAIALVGLGGWENKSPGQLSGGMKQRAGLARALAADAEILLMDEAFSALDPLIRRDMQQELVALQARLRKTVVFVSHDLDEAIALGGRIVLMKDGAIVQAGTAEQILAAPATEYVARFVEHIDASSVLTLSSLADPHTPRLQVADGAAEGIARMAASGRETLPVVEAGGRLLGHVTREALERACRVGARLEDAVEPCPRLGAALPLKQALPVLAEEAGPVAVVDAEDRLVGTLDRAAALTALARAKHTAAPGASPSRTEDA